MDNTIEPTIFKMLEEIFGDGDELQACIEVAKTVIETFLIVTKIVGFEQELFERQRLEKVILLFNILLETPNV